MKNQMFFMRTDMNDVIATGHVMRCLSIADAVTELGGSVSFILADEQAVDLIHERGHQTIELHSKWDDMDAELELMISIVERYEIKSLLIDSYNVTEKYLRALSNKVKIILIDDLNMFVYPVHTLICYAVYWKKFKYSETYRKTELLLGMQYAPLKKIFRDCGRKKVRLCVEKLLILSGGTDSFHILESLLKRIECEKYREINVICGRYYENYDKFCSQYQSCVQIRFHRAVNDVEVYMKDADIAISAGGITLYELCACGTPTISYSFADNQLNNVLCFHEEKLIDYAGDVRYMDIFDKINDILDMYFNDPVLRQNRSVRMQELVDGKGAERIAEAIISAKNQGESQMCIERKAEDVK